MQYCYSTNCRKIISLQAQWQYLLGVRVILFLVLHHCFGNGAGIQDVAEHSLCSMPESCLFPLRQLLLHISKLRQALPGSLQVQFVHRRQGTGGALHKMVEYLEDVPSAELKSISEMYISKKSVNKTGMHAQPFLSTMRALEKVSGQDPLFVELVVMRQEEERAFAPLYRMVMALFEKRILGSLLLNLETKGPLDRWIEDHYREEVERHVASRGAGDTFGLLDMARAEWLCIADRPSLRSQRGGLARDAKEDHARAYSQICHDIDSGKLTTNLQWFIAEVFLPIVAYCAHGYFCYSYMHWGRAIGGACIVDVPSEHREIVCPWKITAPACSDSEVAEDIEAKVSTWRVQSIRNASSIGKLPTREKRQAMAAPSIPVNQFLDYSGHLEYALKIMEQAILYDRNVPDETASSKKIFPREFRDMPRHGNLAPERNSLLAFRSLQLQLDTGDEVWPWVVDSDQPQRIYRLPRVESWSYILSGAQDVEPVWRSLIRNWHASEPYKDRIRSWSVSGVMLVAPLWFPKGDNTYTSSSQPDRFDWQSAFVPVMPVSLHPHEFEVILPTTGSRGGRNMCKVLKGLRPVSAGKSLKDMPKYTLRDAFLEVDRFIKNGGLPGESLWSILRKNNYYGSPKRWRGVDLNELELWAFDLAKSWSGDSLIPLESASAEDHWAQTVNVWFPGMAKAMGIDFETNLKDYRASSKRIDETFLLLRFVAGIALDSWVSLQTHEGSQWNDYYKGLSDYPIIFIGDILDEVENDKSDQRK